MHLLKRVKYLERLFLSWRHIDFPACWRVSASACSRPFLMHK